MDKELYYKKLKQLILIFVFGLFCGCIYFNILWRVRGSVFQNEWGLLLDRILEYSVTDFYGAMQRYTVYILAFHIVIFLLGLIKVGKVLMEGMLISMGFLIGGTETLLLLSFHIKDSLLFLAKVIPVLLVYVFLFGIVFGLACTMSSLRWISVEKSKKWKQIRLKKYLILSLGTLVLHIVYILICSYVNF